MPPSTDLPESTGPAPSTGPVLAHDRRGVGSRVVLVHGFTQSRASWRHVVPALAEDHEVVTLDLPGHGGSADVEVADLGQTADAIARTGGRASYVGYSLGGRCCLTLALDQPAVVERLVLIGATPGIADDAERRARREADEALADRLDPPGAGEGIGLDAFLEEWLAGPLFAHLDPSQADVESRLVNTPRGLAASLRTNGTGTQRPSYDRLGELSMPVLLVAGADDTRFSALASTMAAAIGENASVALVEGSGHAAPFEQPARFIELVAAFLAD